ncbi:hypothetical protein F4808DRAFT_475706 [Astrocystis sublimbata]|nr:hypothetical protein F4808DRAFT_475706 [Astrocystis sublimbata]
MAPNLVLDLCHEVARCLAKDPLNPSDLANFCLSLWSALADDNVAQFDKIFAIIHPDFGKYVQDWPNELNIWLQYVSNEGIYGGLKCLRHILARAAEFGFKPSASTLNAAFEAHNLQAVVILLQYDAPLRRRQEDGGAGPFFFARTVDVVRCLIAAGVDPLEKFEGMNLLHWHCAQVSTSPLLIETLIKAGVPIDDLDEGGRFDNTLKERNTPLGIACANLNLPAIRTLLQHGANPLGARRAIVAQRSVHPVPYDALADIRYPLESLLLQNIRPLDTLKYEMFRTHSEESWGQCHWKHHISKVHEEQDDMEGWEETPTTILPTPSIIADSRALRKFSRSSQCCYECGRGFFLADVDSDVTEKERERQAGVLRFKSWEAQAKRFIKRYHRGLEMLQSAGGSKIFWVVGDLGYSMYLESMLLPLLRAGFCFSPYSGVVRDYDAKPAWEAIIDGICHWDLTQVLVEHFDRSNIAAKGTESEYGLGFFRQPLEEAIESIFDFGQVALLTYSSPITVDLDPTAPLIGPQPRDRPRGWNTRFSDAWEEDVAHNISPEAYMEIHCSEMRRVMEIFMAREPNTRAAAALLGEYVLSEHDIHTPESTPRVGPLW